MVAVRNRNWHLNDFFSMMKPIYRLTDTLPAENGTTMYIKLLLSFRLGRKQSSRGWGKLGKISLNLKSMEAF